MNKKTIITTLIILALIVILTFQWCGSRRLYDKLSLAKGVEQTMTEQLKEKDKAYEELKGKNDETISELNGHIDSLMTVVSGLEEKDEYKNATIEKLEKENEGLTDKDEIIANLNDQVRAWKERFTLAQQQIEAKGGIIFDLKAKYDSEHELRLSLEGIVFDYKKLFIAKDVLIKNLEKSLAKKRFSLKMSRMFEVALIGVGGYLVLKK